MNDTIYISLQFVGGLVIMFLLMVVLDTLSRL